VTQSLKAFGWGKIVRIWLTTCLFLFGALGGLNAAAQENESADAISGYWKQEGASVYILVVNSDGVYEAEMIRNDWSPGLVGGKFFQNVVPSGKKGNRWVGDSLVVGSDRAGKMTLRLRNSGKLSTRSRPGGRAVWQRSEPVEKRK